MTLPLRVSRRAVVAAAVVLATAVPVLAACGTDTPASPAAPAAASNSSGQVTTIAGHTVRVPGTKPTALFFFSVGCGECAGGAKSLAQAARTASGKAEFLAVDMDPSESPQDITSFLKTVDGSDLPAAVDTGGGADPAVRGLRAVHAGRRRPVGEGHLPRHRSLGAGDHHRDRPGGGAVNALLALAFAAGMLAPVNPCGFALLPAWISYSLGDADTAPVPVRLARALRAGTVLTVGFAGTLVAAGLAISAGARALVGAAPWLGLTIGISLVVLGVAMLAGLTLRLRLRTTSTRPARSDRAGIGRLALFGVGYAVASLSCTFGVLLAVIAQAQATASYAGLLLVFAAYAAGAAAILVLVAIATAAAGAALTRRMTALARYGPRITATVLILTGAYLAWYWYPAATSGTTTTTTTTTTTSGAGLTRFSATATTWISARTGTITALAAAAVLIVTAIAVGYRLRRQATSRVDADPTASPGSDCCAPDVAQDLGDRAPSR